MTQVIIQDKNPKPIEIRQGPLRDFYRFICETNENLESELLEEPFVLACLVPVKENIHYYQCITTCRKIHTYHIESIKANRMSSAQQDQTVPTSLWTEDKFSKLWIMWVSTH